MSCLCSKSHNPFFDVSQVDADSTFCVAECGRRHLTSGRRHLTMAAGTSLRVPHVWTVVAVVIILGQVSGSSSWPDCSDATAPSSCCSAVITCSPGFYSINSDNECATPAPVTSATTTMTTVEEDDDDGESPSSTNASTSTTDSTLAETTTTPSISSSAKTSEASSTETSTTQPVTSTSPTTVVCRRCPDRCQTCNASLCVKCDDDYELGDKVCVQKEKKNPLPLAVIIGGAVGGVVFIVVLIVIIVCCCRRCRRSSQSGRRMETMLREREPQKVTPDPEDIPPPAQPPHPISAATHAVYENMSLPTRENFPESIQQGQEKITRYTKDPTLRDKNPDQGVEEEQTEYENQATLMMQRKLIKRKQTERQELEHLPPAPAPPTEVTASQSQRKTRKKSKASESVQELTQEEDVQEIYENTGVVNQGATTEDEEEDYVNVKKEESPYVNVNYK